MHYCNLTNIVFLADWSSKALNVNLVLYFCTKINEMARDETLKLKWDELVDKLSNRFSDGEDLDLDAIIYLVGVQELGQLHRSFKKDEKLNLMHIAICKLLEPYGYYEFDFYDEDGWPHYTIKEQLPTLKAGEQSVLMKEAIVQYFTENGYLE